MSSAKSRSKVHTRPIPFSPRNSFRVDTFHLSLFGIPYLETSLHCHFLWMQSNAFLTSMKFNKTRFYQARHLSIICLNEKIWSQQDQPGRNPAWFGRDVRSTANLIHFSSTLGLNFPAIDSPLQFVHWVRSPFFGSGSTIPLFHLHEVFTTKQGVKRVYS